MKWNSAAADTVDDIYPQTHPAIAQSQLLIVESWLFLVGQHVCLTYSYFVWHTLTASSGTLCEGQNTLEHTDEVG